MGHRVGPQRHHHDSAGRQVRDGGARGPGASRGRQVLQQAGRSVRRGQPVRDPCGAAQARGHRRGGAHHHALRQERQWHRGAGQHQDPGAARLLDQREAHAGGAGQDRHRGGGGFPARGHPHQVRQGRRDLCDPHQRHRGWRCQWNPGWGRRWSRRRRHGRHGRRHGGPTWWRRRRRWYGHGVQPVRRRRSIGRHESARRFQPLRQFRALGRAAVGSRCQPAGIRGQHGHLPEPIQRHGAGGFRRWFGLWRTFRVAPDGEHHGRPALQFAHRLRQQEGHQQTA